MSDRGGDVFRATLRQALDGLDELEQQWGPLAGKDPAAARVVAECKRARSRWLAAAAMGKPSPIPVALGPGWSWN